MEVKFEGNTYIVRGSDVYKKHGDGEKKVGNPDKIKAVLHSTKLDAIKTDLPKKK